MKLKRILLTITVLIMVFTFSLTAVEATSFGTCRNGTGTATGSPIALALGANTVTTTAAGTFIVNLPLNLAGTAASGTATVTGSPVTLSAGKNTITTTGTGTITVTVTISYPDVRGTYECSGVVTEYRLDGTKEAVLRNTTIVVTTQTDGAISVAAVYLGGEETASWILEGFVGTDPCPRMTLYADSGETTGYPIVLNAVVKLNKDGSVKFIQGSFDGLLDGTPDLQISGRFKGQRIPPI